MQVDKRVAFHTLGCKLNYSETSSLTEQFVKRGYTVVPYGDPADLLVINTCTVTENAVTECRKIVRRGLKGAPHAAVAVTGCYAQLQPEVIASIDGVKAVFGTAEKARLAEHADEIGTFDVPRIYVSELTEETSFVGARTSADDSRTRAFLKLQDGCDYSCTFCTIPLARGPARAMAFDRIPEELRRLQADGYHEVVLTGINLGEYEAAQPQDPKSGARRFVDVVKLIDGQKPRFRVRISSIEPNTLTPEIIHLVAASDVFVPHLHVPLQSGSADILKRMKRRYNPAMYRQVVDNIYSAMPDAALGIDVIVGFPGETDSHFHETVQFLESIPWTYLHVFTYSERENTPAASYAERIPLRVRKERTATLRALSDRRRTEHYTENLGTQRTIIPEHYDAEAGGWFGWTENYVRTLYKAPQLIVAGPAVVTLRSLADGYVITS